MKLTSEGPKGWVVSELTAVAALKEAAGVSKEEAQRIRQRLLDLGLVVAPLVANINMRLAAGNVNVSDRPKPKNQRVGDQAAVDVWHTMMANLLEHQADGRA